MIEILLAIIAAELGLALFVGMGIFGMEFYSLYLRYKVIREEAAVTKIRLTPEEMEGLLSGKGVPSLAKAPGSKPVAEEAVVAAGQYL